MCPPMLSFFKIILAIHAPLRFHINFRLDFFFNFCKKNHFYQSIIINWDFYDDYILSVDHFSSMDILPIISNPINKHGICSHLCLNFFQQCFVVFIVEVSPLITKDFILFDANCIWNCFCNFLFSLFTVYRDETDFGVLT